MESTWREKLVFVQALLHESEPSKDMDAYLKEQLKDTLTQLSSMTAEDEELWQPEHKTETNNEVVDAEYLLRSYQTSMTRPSRVYVQKHVPKSPLRYDEFLAIRTEFAPYQFPFQNQVGATFVMAHLSIWMIGRLLRMAKKL